MIYDATIIGGGPSGSTAAEALAKKGFKVALIDRAGRIKPCGGAVPPRLINDFEIPDSQLVAKIKTARMISPTSRKVDIPIENGFVGMVDREFFDEFLRSRAQDSGAHRFTGTFKTLSKNSEYTKVSFENHASKKITNILTRYVIGADGAKSNVARISIKDAHKIPYVIAYHEIIKAPGKMDEYDPNRCDVIYDGQISPDFYGWVFPHGKSASVGMGTGINGVDLKKATSDLRVQAGLDKCQTIRKEGAPIPLKPLEKWDNEDNVVLAGDAAGVVAPSSGEGIYYAMIGGQHASEAVEKALINNNPKYLAMARNNFMKEHKAVFQVLGAMQNAYYRSDERRERFVTLCKDIDVQRITFENYMHKKLLKSRPFAHLKIMFKNIAHLTGMVKAV